MPIMLGFLGYKLTAKRLAKKLEANSSSMNEPIVGALVKKAAHSLDIEKIKGYFGFDCTLKVCM